MKAKVLKKGTKRYSCPLCGRLFTVHSDFCPRCRQRHNCKNRR